jgi:hypothetical protein
MIVATEIAPTTSDYAELARRPLEAEQCALVVIDIQQKMLPPIFQKEQIVRNAQLLIRAAGILKIPILLSTQYAKGLGPRFQKSPPCSPAPKPSTRRCSPASAATPSVRSSSGSPVSATRCCCAAWRATSASRRPRSERCVKDIWCTSRPMLSARARNGIRKSAWTACAPRAPSSHRRR